jgi:hypothetical protein
MRWVVKLRSQTSNLLFRRKEKAPFDVLHCFFEGDFGGGCQQEMDVIGHDDEGVEFDAVLLALLLEDFD